MTSLLRLCITLLLLISSSSLAVSQSGVCTLLNENAPNNISPIDPLRPDSSFPNEPPLTQPGSSANAILGLAEQDAQSGQLQKALRSVNEVVDGARRANVNEDLAFALRDKANYLLYLKQNQEALLAVNEAVDKFGLLNDSASQVRTLVRFGYELLRTNNPGSDDFFQRGITLAAKETGRPGATSSLLRDVGFDVRSFNLKWSIALFNIAVELCRKYANGSWELGLNLENRATLATESANFSEAERQLQEVLGLWKKLSADVSSHVAVINQRLQSLDQKDADSLRAYQNEKQRLLANLAYFDGEVARAQMDLASLAHETGDVTAEEVAINTANEILQHKVFEPRLMTRLLQAHSALKFNEGKLACASDELLHAIRLGRTTEDPYDLSRSFIGLSRVAAARQNYSSAMDYLDLAGDTVDRLGRPPSLYAQLMYAFGEMRALRGDKEEARYDLDSALALYQRFNMPLRIAEIKLLKSSFEINRTAEEDARDLNEAREEVAGVTPRSLNMAKTLISLGIASRNNEESERDFQAAAEILQRIAPNTLAMAATKHNLMGLALNAGKLDDAEKFATEAWQLVLRLSPEFAGEESGQSFSRFLANYGASLAEIQMSRKQIKEAFLTLERARGRSLLQLLTQRSTYTEQQWQNLSSALTTKYSAQNEFYRAFNGRRVAERALASLEANKASDFQIGKAVDLMRAKRQEELQQEYMAALANARLDSLWREAIEARGNKTDELLLADLQKSIPQGTVFLLYAQSRNSMLVFATKGGSTDIVSERIDASALNDKNSLGRDGQPLEQFENSILRFRKALETNSSTDLTSTNALGQTLFATVFPGRISALVLASDRLVISPEIFLWQLPFAALVTTPGPNKKPEYLGLSKPITYTQSLSLFQRARNQTPVLRKGQKPVALVVGDPLFNLGSQTSTDVGPASQNTDDAPETTWAGLARRSLPPEPLPNSKAEARSVACIFGSGFLTEREANEVNVRNKIENADVIHLATHAVLHRGLPMSTGILLSPPSQDPNPGETDKDGALQAWEVFSQMRLRAELVVLSACDTALGTNIRGEGNVGLVRAFQYAGARSVLATQWQIQDESTRTVMIAFYNNLNSGFSKDQALEKAMSIVAANPTTASPHYWAAFTLTGSPDNPNLSGLTIAGCN